MLLYWPLPEKNRNRILWKTPGGMPKKENEGGFSSGVKKKQWKISGNSRGSYMVKLTGT